MLRVSVVGNSGAGKSTLASGLARALGFPYLELDGVFHQPNWTPLDADEFRARVAEFVAGEHWVVDGNYSVVRPIVWARVDTVVWLDLPRRVVMWQVVNRSVRRLLTRRVLWNGNRESARNLVRWRDENIVLWAWRNHARYADQFIEAAIDPANERIRFVRIASRSEAREFLADAAAEAASAV
jgi:adenylate kinase family enzyme